MAAKKSIRYVSAARCGLKPSEVHQRVERVCEAIVEVSPDVVRASRNYKNFATTGPRMLHAWNEGMNSLRLSKNWSIPSLDGLSAAGHESPQPTLTDVYRRIQSFSAALIW